MEELEIARAMRDGLRSEPVRKLLEAATATGRSTEGALQPDRPVPADARGSQPSWPRRLLDLIATPQWAVPATAAAGILALLLVAQPGTRSGKPLPVVAQLELARTRGEPEGEPAEISIGRDGVVALTVDAAGLDANTLRGTILSGKRRVTDLPLTPDPHLGFAQVVVPAAILPRGDYVLELRDGRGGQLSYAFRVIP